MNPDQQRQTTNTSQPQNVAEPHMDSQPTMAVAPQKKSIKLPVILMVWPATTFVFIFALSIVVNMLSGDASGGLLGADGPIKIITNIIVFLGGALAVIAGPVSFIVGLVLLIVRKTKV